MTKTIYDVIVLEKQVELLNTYQGQLVDRTKRLQLENDLLGQELDEAHDKLTELHREIQEYKKALQRRDA